METLSTSSLLIEHSLIICMVWQVNIFIKKSKYFKIFLVVKFTNIGSLMIIFQIGKMSILVDVIN